MNFLSSSYSLTLYNEALKSSTVSLGTRPLHAEEEEGLGRGVAAAEGVRYSNGTEIHVCQINFHYRGATYPRS